MDACQCFWYVCSRGQRCGGEGLWGADEVSSGHQLHPAREAQPHRGWNLQNREGSCPHRYIITETGGRAAFLLPI